MTAHGRVRCREPTTEAALERTLWHRCKRGLPLLELSLRREGLPGARQRLTLLVRRLLLELLLVLRVLRLTKRLLLGRLRLTERLTLSGWVYCGNCSGGGP